MKQLTLHSDKANFYSKILRTFFVLAGLMYLGIAFTEFYPEASFDTVVILNLGLGITFISVSLLKSGIGTNIELFLTDKFLRAKEDFEYIRTAHWHQVLKVVLTRFSIRITYKSRTSERFRLPYLSTQEFEDLKLWLINHTDQNGISFKEKPWWYLF